MILNLILYNDSKAYSQMRNILDTYLSAKGINYYFYCYRKDISDEYVFDGKMLYIRGLETFIPGVLKKTLSAFEICRQKFEFRYLVRTNISTIVNFDLLTKYLESTHIDYGGPSLPYG